jgi:hypothetical protein
MRVLKVEYVNDYRLNILFSDKKTKIVDLEEKIKHAKGIFLPLKKLDYFKKVTIDDCHLSICWPNGADICPDVLYNIGKNLKIEKKPKQMPKQLRNIRRKTKQPA